MSHSKNTANHNIVIPSFFSGEIFPPKILGVFDQMQKFTISGVPNISAKFFVLQKLLQKNTHFRNIFFVLDAKNEIHECVSLAPLFFSDQESPFSFHILPFSEEEGREREKTQWIRHYMNSEDNTETRNIFFCTKEDMLDTFPQPKSLEKEKITLSLGMDISSLTLFRQLVERGYELTSDIFLKPGEYRRSGNMVDIFPLGNSKPVKIEISYDSIESIFEFSLESKQLGKKCSSLDIYPVSTSGKDQKLSQILSPKDLQIWNELEGMTDSFYTSISKTESNILEYSSFPENEETSEHLNFLSVLKFYNLGDILQDFRTKAEEEWKLIVLTKRNQELENILLEERIPFSHDTQQDHGIILLEAGDLEVVPPSFQNQKEKIGVLTDREIFHLHGKRKKVATSGVNVEFLTSLKAGDLIVHLDHGIGRFLGICEQEISGNTREYLEISYLGSDKLYVPVDQADKVSRFIAEDGKEPKLTRLGGAEWKNVQKRVNKEAERIAKELLGIYAKRAQSAGIQMSGDTERQREFEKNFPYVETPGQLSAISDIKQDLENSKPMDRLVCGDVGFGKTEVAMRAAFKVVESGKQVVFIAPITILAYQHYQTFLKRMNGFDVRIEMISRFRTPAQQKKILAEFAKGKIDILIGTHRLLSDDVKMYDLGLVIIDEEQRFGVKQKEKFKKMRAEVSILTLSATPIPRTLNLALHKLRDISTITTPPPGRLPIITEVRKYSDRLIREAILKETGRGGQVYFLHNKVETIEAMAHKLRQIIPEARFVVGHGQMKADVLEDRILDFKEKKYDVLVSSTIIENGIDLSNANTMIVNNAQDFGLSQLYQLRGRIGRSKKQAYCYLLHSTQKLSLNAKKRLKALIEASELGSGFQLSMRDLEIRGAGDVLGINQHGTVNVVGVSHFLRLLNKKIKELQSGKKHQSKDEEIEVTIDLPLDAYIPSTYISDSKEKILMYQKLAGIQSLSSLKELQEEITEEYGRAPQQVQNLCTVLEIKILAKASQLKTVKSVSTGKTDQEIHLALSPKVTAVEIMNLLKVQSKWMVSGETLKCDMKHLGFDWISALKEAIQLLKK